MNPLLKATVEASVDGFKVSLPKVSALKPGVDLGGVAHGADGLVLLREALCPQGYLAGSFGSMGIGELFGHLISGVRSGKLWVSHGAVHKSVSLKEGQLIFATSSEPYERLGVFLVQRGLISPDQLDEALEQVEPGQRLGQVLTRTKVLSPAALYGALAELVKEIVLGLFELADGHFLFLEGGPRPDDAVKLPERTREILLAGFKRAEQLSRLRRKLDAMVRVTLGPAAPKKGLDAWLKPAAQGAELMVLQSNFDGSEFTFLTRIDGHLEKGVLTLEAPAQVTPGPKAGAADAPSALELYRSLLQTLCTAMTRAGHGLADLRSFLDEPLPGMESAFEGVTLSDEGLLDVPRLIANLNGQGGEAIARALAYEALDSFVAYALFSAKNVLPPELAGTLASEFRQIQRGVEG